MSTDSRPNARALAAAEEILRTIYGDDLKGCSVTLEQIAGIIENSFGPRDERVSELMGLYEKVIEAFAALSTPPDKNKVTSPAELQSLLSDRLDKIYTITQKTMETSALFRTEEGAS